MRYDESPAADNPAYPDDDPAYHDGPSYEPEESPGGWEVAIEEAMSNLP